MNILILAVLGLVVGHLVRRFTPHMLGMSDRSLPFAGPFVELIGGMIFVIMGNRLGMEPSAWTWYLFAASLLAVGSADAHTKYIPTMVCYLATPVAILLNAIAPDTILDLLQQHRLLAHFGFSVHKAHLGGALLAGAGAVMGFCLIEFIRRVFRPLVGVEVMGSGDSVLMLMIGAFIGPKAVLFCLFPACIAGIVIGGIRLAIYKVPHSAFGPALALGALTMLLFGSDLIALFGRFYAQIYNLPPIIPLLFSVFLVLVLLLLLLRIRRKASEYEEIMEKDYAEIDKKM